ncbi:transposase [Janthinobacterium sp. BJB401]|uniref:REP-associated tyrosine transposase n=1 Tax=Janthinobacterium sp. BJB401 TaxID=2745934 RepID=UPI0015963364|nr:transposase [Janthinobacterium sp. BJB401]NVI83643.1 transposase [Janthinobacterium sp. BJB401]
MRYRRASQPGGSFFFTVVTAHRRPVFSSTTAVNLLRDAFRAVRHKRPFAIDAIVILPDHLHCIWTLPDSDADFMTRWRLIKTWFSKHAEFKDVWQHRFWEHVLRDESDFANHVDYIHYNPVKHGLVSKAIDWPYSSFHRYARQGWCAADWGGDGVDVAGVGRE